MPSQNLFDALLEGSADHIYVVDRDFRYTQVSRGGAEAVGFTPEAMRGRTWRDLGLPPAIMDPVQHDWEEIFATGATLRRETAFDTPTGKRHFEYFAFPVREGDAVTAIITVSRDITTRVQIEAELGRTQERYRSFVTNSSEAIWRFELDAPIDASLPPNVQVQQMFDRGYLAECNDAMAKMYGFDRAEDIVGARLNQMLDPTVQSNRDFLAAAVNSGYRLVDAESVEVDREGHRKYFMNSFVGVVEHGTLMRAWGTQRDVTSQRATEVLQRELSRQENERSRFIAEANDLFAQSLDYEQTLRNLAAMAVPRLADWCAVDMIDPDGTVRRLAVQHTDPERIKLAFDVQERYPADKTSPRGMYGVIRSGLTDWMREIPDELIEAAAHDPEHLAMLRALRLKSYICAPIKVHGRVVGVLTLVNSGESRLYDERDVRLAEVLAVRASYAIDNAMAYRAALEANRSKDEFLATVSHELRTPLTAILGWANLARLANYDAATMRNAMEMIERSATTQAALIDDLLDVSRIITGKFHLDRSAVDLVRIVRDVITASRPAAEAKRITIEVNAPETLLIQADPNRMQQIVWNLVSNAVKFSNERGRIDVAVVTSGGNVSIRVHDEGIGISPELLPRVFDRFWQADSATNRSHGGLGLGLAIVKHLAELHGGTAEAQSAGGGRGATFTVTIPIGEPQKPVSKAARHVLVVDDDPDARAVVGKTLEMFGANVARASGAEEALALVERNGFDLVVTDIAMPGHDGYWLLNQIRALKPALRVTAMTALSVTDQKLRDAGFDSWLRKPVDPDRLRALL